MRILVVGAGAIGGYFGARLAAAGRDVTFLVRPKRAEQLAHGLFVRSPKGDVTIAAPKVVTEATLPSLGIPSLAPAGDSLAGRSVAARSLAPFDLVLLSCKSFDLEGAMDSFARGVGPATVILPMLNGMAHIEKLQARFGAGAVLGGQCHISTTLDAEGHVIHLNDAHLMGYGELDGSSSARIEAVNASLTGANFQAALSLQVPQDMWEKWIFIATMAGVTCLMRAALGDIEKAGGTALALALFGECSAIAARNDHPLSAAVGERIRKTLTTPGSTLTASMLRDIEGRQRTEHEHVLGDLFSRAKGVHTPVLEICLAHLRAYEARRLREG
jgi:2-dehydropantoate 2-reductase